MKLSKYNHIFEHPTDKAKKVMCNYRTCALVVISALEHEQYQQLCEDSTYPINDELKAQLLEGGFIFNDDTDESKIMEIDMLRWRYSTTNLTLTIAPTMNCNFRCIYCYEKDIIKNVEMQPVIQQALINFVREKAGNISGLNITWYGGEPLMAWDVVVKLTCEMKKICAEYKIQYNASLITNGYLITEDIAKQFEDLEIKNVQVTIDGPQNIHDKRRILSNGRGTFARIMENLKYLVDYANVSIRINIDTENMKTLENDLFSVFEENGLTNKVHICFGYVDAINNSYAPEKCLSMETYSKEHLKFMENNGLDIMGLYPRPLDNYCGADSVSTYVIDPEGNLYKCWSDIGIDNKKVGNVSNGEQGVFHNCLGMEYLSYNPANDSLCKECEVLPICKGGCPNKRIANLKRCSEHKFVIEDYFKTCIDILVLRQNS